MTVLHYQAPHLAASCLASVFQGSIADALVLDVACGTGLVAQEVMGIVTQVASQSGLLGGLPDAPLMMSKLLLSVVDAH